MASANRPVCGSPGPGRLRRRDGTRAGSPWCSRTVAHDAGSAVGSRGKRGGQDRAGQAGSARGNGASRGRRAWGRVRQRGAGAGIGASDDEYRAAGAAVVDTAEEIYARAELIVKVKEPQEAEPITEKEEQPSDSKNAESSGPKGITGGVISNLIGNLKSSYTFIIIFLAIALLSAFIYHKYFKNRSELSEEEMQKLHKMLQEKNYSEQKELEQRKNRMI